MSFSTPEAAAFALLQSGQLDAAEAAARQLLAVRPGNADALHLLGLVLVRTGRGAEGLALLDRALEIEPRHPGFLNNRALVLAESGRIAEAERDVRHALQAEPRFAEAFAHLGSLLRRQGRLEEATAAFRRALQAEPGLLDARVGLGNVLRERGDVDAARREYEAVLASDPGHAGAHYNLGAMFLEAGAHAEAEQAFRRALARDPAHAAAWNNLGVVLRHVGRAEDALAAFDAALRASPRYAEALNNRGLALRDAGRGAEAESSFAEAAAVAPAFVPALVNRANAMKDRGDFAAASDLLDRAIREDPSSFEAVVNRAGVAVEAGDLSYARRLYKRSLEMQPESPDARFGIAQIDLREGRFVEGWEGYERRFDTDPPQATLRAPALPHFERDDLGRGLAVAMWPEQGVGDQILFSTLLPAFVATGARPVVEVDARLLEAYRRSLPGIAFVAPEESERAFAACDRHLPLGSLPWLLRPDRAAFDAQPEILLRADPKRVAAIRAALGPGRWVGVSWRSLQPAARAYLEARKSMPVEAIASLAERGLRLLDLQYGDVEPDRENFAARHPGALTRVPGLDLRDDLDGLLAALEACEAVVTVSNATAHLSAAAGRPTAVLFRANRSPFHYWDARRGTRSLWYPSTEVVTGHEAQGWSDLVGAAATRLGL